MKYICSKCGQEHEGWPAIAFKTPSGYDGLSQQERNSIAEIDDDVCIIRYEDQTDRFIRCVLKQFVVDHCDYLEYGVWVSLSEKSLNDYLENYNNAVYEKTYFGFLATRIPGYEDTLNVKANVVTNGKKRPEIIPHQDQLDHSFVKDYYDGITKDEAEGRIQQTMKNDK